MKKRIIALCIAAVAVLSLAACGALSDQGPRWDGYKDAPLPANAEPNWDDITAIEGTIMDDHGPRWDGYKDAPLPENAEPNWDDTAAAQKASEASTAATTQDNTTSDDGEVCIDEGPYWDSYKDVPLPENAEPNWDDTAAAQKAAEASTAPTTQDDTTSDDWVLCIDEGPYWDGYKDVPLPPNAEPNWND